MQHPKPLQWIAAMSVGDGELDRQHRELIDLVNLVCEAGEAADEGATTERVNQLLNRSRDHFRDEERLLAEVGYPELERHAEEHAQLMERIVAVAQLAAHHEVTPRVMQLLRDWMIEHMFEHDKPYVSFLNRNRRGPGER